MDAQVLGALDVSLDLGDGGAPHLNSDKFVCHISSPWRF